jgi:hypothetical protein
MWRLSGIHRDVHLAFRPGAAHIADFAVRTPLRFREGGGGPELISARLEVEAHLVGTALQATL